jgi:preprotein translocase subunit SecG
MFEFLIVVISIIGVLMTLGILLQSGKGGGLAGIASGGATTQILGSRQAPDFLEKTTWTLGGLFIVLCILTTFTIDTDETTDSIIQTQTQTQPLVPSTPGSDAGAPTGTDAGAPSGSDATPPPSGDDGNN